jgi:putative transcriptional regulator
MVAMSLPRLIDIVAAVVLLLIGVSSSAVVGSEPPAVGSDGRPSLAGHFLVAAAQLNDPNFEKTVVYMVRHDATGALGLIVNRPIGRGPLSELLRGFGIDSGKAAGDAEVVLHAGGPVERRRAFALHSTDYADPVTLSVGRHAALSALGDVLQAIGDGHGPRRLMLALGYAGWGPGQLENEIDREDWLVAPFDEELAFGGEPDSKWQRAMRRAGLDL